MIEGISTVDTPRSGFGLRTLASKIFLVFAQLEGGVGSIRHGWRVGTVREEDENEALRCNHNNMSPLRF